MITLVVEAVLGILLVIVLMNLFKKKTQAKPEAIPQADLANLKPNEARTGDVISVSGAGDEMTDLDFTVDRTTWFQAGWRNWTELSGPYRERRAALRVASEEQLEVAVQNDPRKLTIETLGITEDDMAQMDERQNTADSFEFDGKIWFYRLSREGVAKREDQPQQPVGFYYWEFREENGPGLLALRKLEGEPFAVTLYRGVPAADVTVYRGRG